MPILFNTMTLKTLLRIICTRREFVRALLFFIRCTNTPNYDKIDLKGGKNEEISFNHHFSRTWPSLCS